MSGTAYLAIILGIIGIGISLVILLRVYNILADVEILGFKLPKI